MTETKPSDLESLARALAGRSGSPRSVVAIVGAPGSGKSFLADKLKTRLDAEQPGSAAVLPMDGYHFDDAILIARGLLARKGSPETFDVGGLLHMLNRLKRNEEHEIAVPVFDRALEISRAGARIIPRAVRHLIVEGNYLLLDTTPWSSLRPLFDITVSARVPEDELRRRLTQRWRDGGLPPAEIAAKVENNDMPNGRFVMTNSVAADVVLDN